MPIFVVCDCVYSTRISQATLRPLNLSLMSMVKKGVLVLTLLAAARAGAADLEQVCRHAQHPKSKA